MSEILNSNGDPVHDAAPEAADEGKMSLTQSSGEAVDEGKMIRVQPPAEAPKPGTGEPVEVTFDPLWQEKKEAEDRIIKANEDAERIREKARAEAASLEEQMAADRKLACADSYLARIDHSGRIQATAQNSLESAINSSRTIQNNTCDALQRAKEAAGQAFHAQIAEIADIYDQAFISTKKTLSDWRGSLYNEKLSGLLNAYVNLFNFTTRVVPSCLAIDGAEELKAKKADLCVQMNKLRLSFEKQLIALRIELGKE